MQLLALGQEIPLSAAKVEDAGLGLGTIDQLP
jgi:hypothetical protein